MSFWPGELSSHSCYMKHWRKGTHGSTFWDYGRYIINKHGKEDGTQYRALCTSLVTGIECNFFWCSNFAGILIHVATNNGPLVHMDELKKPSWKVQTALRCNRRVA